jgi:hypothetical protein
LAVAALGLGLYKAQSWQALQAFLKTSFSSQLRHLGHKTMGHFGTQKGTLETVLHFEG